MDLVIHGVNRLKKRISLSNYSLASQIVIINFSTAFAALIFLILFNFYLLTSNENIIKQNKLFLNNLKEISEYLGNNAIKRILTFDDSCNSVSESQESEEIKIENREENRIDCQEAVFISKNYDDKPPQLDPTYTQKYIYTNFLNKKINVKVFTDDWSKLADTNDVYATDEEIFISDITSKNVKENNKKINIFSIYKETYFKIYNLLQKYFDEKKVIKIKNENITVRETIKTKNITSYMYKDSNNDFKTIFAGPILKDDKVYGVVLMVAPLSFVNDESASQSMLLTTFFLFFISVMFVLSFLFSKSIITPIKLLSKNTQLERSKTTIENESINYPQRNDEIGILSKEIKNMSEDLKKRINEIEGFAADVSHELKNPLASLKSTSELLLNNKISNEKKSILLKNIQKDVHRINTLITDIAKYTLAQIEIEEEAFYEFNLVVFLKELLESYSSNSKNIKIIFQSESESTNIYANREKLAQVFLNLIDNSISHSPSNSKILIKIKVIDNIVKIHILDQGPGIDSKLNNKIFERFYTDRPSTQINHSGLGLSIAKNIIESFGGSISLVSIDSQQYLGACFEINLPLKEN